MMRLLRISAAALLVAILIALAAMSNAIWQNVYCGTPLCQVSPFSPIPCEPADQVLAEWREWERMGRDHPATQP